MNKGEYSNDLGFYVGRFNEEELLADKDNDAINVMREEIPQCRYVNTKNITKGGKVIAKDIWICTLNQWKH